MIKCYWYHEGSCDQSCSEVQRCSNYKELDGTNDLLELKAEDNFNDRLIETIDRYRSRFHSCCHCEVV